MNQTRTYAQMKSDAHAVGGQTQTEAMDYLHPNLLNRSSVGFLRSVLVDLYREADACSTEADYFTVRPQIDRVRAALIKKNAL